MAAPVRSRSMASAMQRDGGRHLLVRGGASQAEAERSPCLVGRIGHRGEHMRGLQGAGGAGRAGRAAQPVEVERHDQRGTVRVTHQQGAVVGEPLSRVSGELHAGQRLHRVPDEVAPSRHLRHRRGALLDRQLEGPRETHGAGHVLGAGAPIALLAAAVQLRQDGRAAPQPQRTDALGALQLVAGHREQVHAQRSDVDIQPGRSLHGVKVDERRRLGAHPRHQLGDGLDGADLVVGQLQRDQHCLLGERRAELVGVDPAVAIDRQPDDLEPELLEVAAGVEHGVVLDRAGDDAVAGGLAGPCGTLDGQVDGLGAAAGEDHLARVRTDAAGDHSRAPRPGRRAHDDRRCAARTGCRSPR